MNRFLLLFGGIWLLVGLPFAVVGLWLFHGERRFAGEARLATGIVLSKDVSRNRDSDGSTSTNYSVRYRFRAPDGQVREGRGDVDHDDWRRLVEREPIEIAFAASDPSTHRIHGTTNTLLAAIFSGLGGLFTIAGAIILSFGVRGGRRLRRLRETGVPADAVVTRVETTHVTFNKRRQARVHYEFRDDRGATRAGHSGYMPVAEAMRWKKGDRISVRYDREHSQQSIWDAG